MTVIPHATNQQTNPSASVPAAPSAPVSSRSISYRLALPILLFLIAALISAARINHQPEFDELYHILAARGWLETGRFVIAEGEYNRASLFTMLVAALFRLFGESLFIARLPSALAYCVLVTAFFMWMHKQTSPLAAWTATILLLSSPFIVELATFIRFYSIQVMVFAIAIMCIQTSLMPEITNLGRIIRWIISIIFLVLATYLQIVSLIGILGLVTWLLLEKIGPWYLAQSRTIKLLWLATVLVAAVGMLYVLSTSEMLSLLIQRFREAPGFQQDTVNQFWFYHLWLIIYYPLLWAAFPILLLAALAAFPQIARLSGAIFIIAFSVSSFAGSKDTRYLAYAFPFLFAIFGMGIAAMWPSVRSWLHNTLWLVVSPPVSDLARVRWETVAVALCLLFVIMANGATPRLVTMLAGIRLPPQPPLVNWAAAVPTLQPLLAKSDVVVTNDELSALYYLGTYDVLMSSSRLSELPNKHEFARDFRTGKVVVASASALETIMECFKTGLVVLDRVYLGSARPGVTALLAKRMRPLPLPREWTLDAYVWDHRIDPATESLCNSIAQNKRIN